MKKYKIVFVDHESANVKVTCEAKNIKEAIRNQDYLISKTSLEIISVELIHE